MDTAMTNKFPNKAENMYPIWNLICLMSLSQLFFVDTYRSKFYDICLHVYLFTIYI